MKKRVTIVMALVLGLMTLASWLAPLLLYQNRTLPGLHLEGVQIGELPTKELEEISGQISQKLSKTKLKISFGEHEEEISYQDLGIEPNITATIERASQFGKKGWLWERWNAYYRLLQGEANLNFSFKFDRGKAYKTLSEIISPLMIKPTNAELSLNNQDQVIIKPAVMGKEADIPKALAAIEMGIVNSEKNRITELVLVEVPVKPDVSTEQLRNMKITGKVAEAVTRFNPGNKERTHNIRLAASKLDNLLFPPGELFSFNEAVGPRTREAGYQDAMIIVENAFEPGLGGGVCQVSTTLYNAALKANLEVKERRRHSLLVNYVPPGLDATVVYGYVDLKLQNNSEAYLWVKTKVVGDALYVKLFGWQEKIPLVNISRIEKVLEPQVISIKDGSLPLGKFVVEQEGKRGYKVQVVRTVRSKAGEILSQEIVSQDIYPAQKRQVRIGIKSTLDDKTAPIETIDNSEGETDQEELPVP